PTGAGQPRQRTRGSGQWAVAGGQLGRNPELAIICCVSVRPRLSCPLFTDHRPQGAAVKLGLINSAGVQSGRGTAWGIRQTKAIGFDTIDVFADPLDLDAKERKLIRTECEAAG